MVKYILALQQLRCNNQKSNNENNGFVKNESIQLVENSHDQPQNKTQCETNNGIDIHRDGKYLHFVSAQKIIHLLLSHNRIVLRPHVIPKLTAFELSQTLNITTNQLKKLRNSSSFYKKMPKHVSLALVNLYCSTALQRPEVIRNGGMRHE